MKPLQLLSRQPLRRQVVAVAVLILLPLLAVTAWAARRVLAEREADLRGEALSLASTGQSTLNQYLATLDSMAAILAQEREVQALDTAEAERLLATARRAEPTLLSVSVDAAPASSRPMLATIDAKPALLLEYPVRRDGRPVGRLAIGVDLIALSSIFGKITLPPESVITLTDRESRVLARTLEPEKYVGKDIEAPGGALEPARVQRSVIRTGVDGVPRVFGNIVIDRGPWLLSVGIPSRVAVARAVPLWKRSVLITSVFALLAFGVALLIAAALTEPLAKLTAAARRIANGDLSPPPAVTTVNLEIAELHRAFDTMAANLREAREKLDRQFDEERRMREVLQSLQRQVVRQERLAAVGVLVSGVAHELNNPLQAILGSAELLERRPGISVDARDEVDLIKTQSQRARDIIRNLSRFSSQQSGPATLVDLRSVIAEVVQLRQRDLGLAAIALDVEIASSRRVFANFTEVEQVVLNFVINAQHAIESARHTGGRIMIRVVDAGKRVRVEVTDDGPGVAAENEPKLFQPFFTTKPVGKGTGLGLSVSYGIIESYGGTIGHHSNEWGGATFFFELPAAEAADSHGDDRTALLQRPVLPGV